MQECGEQFLIISQLVASVNYFPLIPFSELRDEPLMLF